MGFVYRFFTLKGSRLNELLSLKSIIIIILLSLLQCTAQILAFKWTDGSQKSVHSSLPYTHYFLLAGSYSNEIVEASKFLMMLSIGYRIHRFILCAIFTKQASRMHRMGLRVISYQALILFIFSFLPIILLPRVTSKFTDFSLAFNVLQSIIDPIVVLLLTPEYRKLMRIRKGSEDKPIAYAPSAVVPNYTASALDASDGLRISVLPKITEPSLFTRYCSKV